MLFTIEELTQKEMEVLGRIDEIKTNLNYALNTPKRWFGVLRRITFARAIQGSNSIEGINVSVEDAIAAIEGEQPLTAKEADYAAVMGYRNAMTYVLQLSNDPHFTYSEGFLRSLHFMMMHYDLSKNPGKWRPGAIFVRDDSTGKLVYEGPEAEKVPALMNELVVQLSNPNKSLPIIVRAALAHLNLAMIHPFSDGNGRMARGLQTLVLAREGILDPRFCSIEEYLGRNTKEYYDVLGKVGQGSWHPGRDAHPWIQFCLTAHFRQATRLLRRVKEIQRLWEELEQIIKRKGLPERVIYALSDAAMGYRVINSTYKAASETSIIVASRDLKALVDVGLLKPHGERRGRYYEASPSLVNTFNKLRLPRDAENPFDVPNQPELPNIINN